MPIGTFVILLNRRIATIIGDVVMVRREYFLEAMYRFECFDKGQHDESKLLG